MDAILGSIVTGLGPVGMHSGPVSCALLAIPAVGGKAIGLILIPRRENHVDPGDIRVQLVITFVSIASLASFKKVRSQLSASRAQ